MDSIPYSDLRAHLTRTLKQLEGRDEPVLISRRGEPAAVLMSMAQYRRLQGGQGGFGQALLAWRERYADELAAEADGTWQDPFADVRDRSVEGGRPALDFTALMAQPAGTPKAKPRKKPVATAKRARGTRA